MTSRHLLTVWNPSYTASAMDQHLACLLGWVARRDEGKYDQDDVYVWWGKLASPNRQQPLPHRADVLALDTQVKAGEETHLYLTDYRSLYVAEVGEVTKDDVAGEPDEREHLPAFNLESGRRADCWFRLFDIRRLIADDTVGVIEALRPLRNTRYHDRPVSLYGGITDLPLIVTHEAPRSWFGDREALLESRLWANRDARARGQTERLAAQLRDNLVGRALWSALDPGSCVFLASAEAVFRAHRDDPGFDFAVPAVETPRRSKWR